MKISNFIDNQIIKTLKENEQGIIQRKTPEKID